MALRGLAKQNPNRGELELSVDAASFSNAPRRGLRAYPHRLFGRRTRRPEGRNGLEVLFPSSAETGQYQLTMAATP